MYSNRYNLGFEGGKNKFLNKYIYIIKIYIFYFILFKKLDIIDADEEDTHQKKKSPFELWDLSRPLEGDCSLELLKFDDPLGK